MKATTECSNCGKLKAKVRRLEARLTKLEAELRKSKRQAAPFSRDSKMDEPQKPGRKKGQGGFSRRSPPTDEKIETVNVPLDKCPKCGGELEDKQTHENFQSDIPLPEPKHTRYVNESGYCHCCKKRFRSRHPEQVSTAVGAAGVSIGPNAKAVAADLHHRLGVPYAKVADHLKTLSGLDVTPSAFCQSNERLAKKLAPVYEALIAAIRDCCTVYADETGWRIGTLSAWLWVFTSEHITVYVIDTSRGHEVVIEILGREFKGVLVGDCFKAYDAKALADWIKQKCFAHFLKKLNDMEAQKTRGAVRFPRQVAELLRDALTLEKQKPGLSALQFTRRLKKVERRLDALINEGRKFSDPDNRRFAKRLRKQRKHLFTFLNHDEVEATNNRAERMLRPAVILRKTGACNKTKKGARTHSINASVLQTARQQGGDPIGYMVRVLTAPEAPPSLLAPAPDSS